MAKGLSAAGRAWTGVEKPPPASRLDRLLERDGRPLSESTIGRILKRLVNLNRVKPRKRRDFSTGHAQRWTGDGREAGLGRMVQIEDLPYPLKSIRVDNGSEFRAGFEDACEALGIPRFVLPPKSPRLNGVVEPANDSSRVEFRSQHAGESSVREAQAALAGYQHFCNCTRPHSALELMTPMEHVQQCA